MNYNIEIYTKLNCPYCDKAKKFFVDRNLNFKEIFINNNSSNIKYLEMLRRSQGKKTVPQIFINDHHIGGWDDLIKMNEDPKTLNRLIFSINSVK